MSVDLRPHREDVLCEFCGETMDAQGNDPWDLLFTSHYCPGEGPGPI